MTIEKAIESARMTEREVRRGLYPSHNRRKSVAAAATAKATRVLLWGVVDWLWEDADEANDEDIRVGLARSEELVAILLSLGIERPIDI